MSCERCFSFKAGVSPATWPEDINRCGHGQPNRISSVRFTVLTWLPKSLYMQFHRAANLYFLVVSVLVCLDWSPTSWSSTVIPFAAVLLWTALKDLYEDMLRRRDDDAENMRPCRRYDFVKQCFIPTHWRHVLCGDVLFCQADEAFPADMAIIGASQGQAFISTANLDGETSLKERRAADICGALLASSSGLSKAPTAGGSQASIRASLASAEASIQGSLASAEAAVNLLMEQGLEASFEAPRVGLTEMRGSMHLKTKGCDVEETLARLDVKLPSTLRHDHFAPRGCVLRNTPWLIAVVSYVGKDTQAWLNATRVKPKISNLQKYLNNSVKGLVAALVTFCLYAAIMSQVFGQSEKSDFFVDFLKYWIILYQIVPISLYVCFEIMKLLLGFLIHSDPLMMDSATQARATARTTDLVEEMGQVRHVFSDKTGTLTQNEMRLARCCIGGEDLGEFRPDALLRAGSQRSRGSAPPAEPAAVQMYDPVRVPGIASARRILEDEANALCLETRRFFLCLAVCHDAQVELSRTGDPSFSGSSPDEVALLEGAHRVGVSLRDRRAASGSASSATLAIDGPGGREDLAVHCMVPFSSDRKRMTVLCESRGEFICFTKGADSVMGPLCQPGSVGGAAAEQLERYARLGLRTLILAWKVLDAQTAAAWRQRYEAARNAVEDRKAKLQDCAAEVEHSLTYLGISAVEDRLQEGVPAAISFLKDMGILVWVLTGDKTETAVEIARSCELLSHEMPLITLVRAVSYEDAKGMLASAQARGTRGAALVLDGAFVSYALNDHESRVLLYDVAMMSQACVCCRLAPQQKRALIEMTRELDPTRITLAVGDGANDVAMIQGAHVGVAVQGKEGNQAVQASDVVVPMFRFLIPLLHCHGRRAYRRMSVFLCYYIYKHVVLAVGSICWAHESRFDGNVAYAEWLSSAYSVLFTSLPVIIIVGLDRDLPDLVALSLPELYEEGTQRMHFNTGVFVAWMLRGIWHGVVAWTVPSLVLGAANASIDDWGGTFWVSSVTSFTLVVLFVNLQLWLISLNPLALKTLLVLLLVLLVYVVTLLLLGHTMLGDWMQWQIVGVPLAMVANAQALAVLLLLPLAVFFFDASAARIHSHFRPTPLEHIRQHCRGCKVSRVRPDPPLPHGERQPEAQGPAAREAQPHDTAPEGGPAEPGC